jgi:hypothetical protein
MILGINKDSFVHLPHYLQADIRMVFQLGNDHFLANRIQESKAIPAVSLKGL